MYPSKWARAMRTHSQSVAPTAAAAMTVTASPSRYASASRYGPRSSSSAALASSSATVVFCSLRRNSSCNPSSGGVGTWKECGRERGARGVQGQAAEASWHGNANVDPPWSPRFVCRHTFPQFGHTAVALCGDAGGGSAEPAAAGWARRRTRCRTRLPPT